MHARVRMLPSVLDCKCSVEAMPSRCELVSVTAMHRRCSDRALYAHYCVLQSVLTACAMPKACVAAMRRCVSLSQISGDPTYETHNLGQFSFANPLNCPKLWVS